MEQKNLIVKRGDTKKYTLYFKDDDGAVNITGWIVFFTVKEKVDDTDNNAKIKKTIITHVDVTQGKSQIELSPTDTDLVGNYLYDIQIKKATNEINTILEGTIVFTKDITQRTS